MKSAFLAATILMASTLTMTSQALASMPVTEPVYYKGEQPVGIAGDVVECFVEAEYSNNGLTANVRTITADAHDGDLVGNGPVELNYDVKELGYSFLAADAHDKIQKLFLASKQLSSSESLDLTVLDGSHSDSVQCLGLKVPQGAELASVKDKFDHFEDYAGEEGHDHDHNEH